MTELQDFRDEILKLVKEKMTFKAIEKKIDDKITVLGAENCHRKHIGEVMGHRVYLAKGFFWKFFKFASYISEAKR